LDTHPASPALATPDARSEGASAATPPIQGTARNALIESIGYVLSIVIRLGSNLILTRLLFPDVFGLMSMVQLLLYSLHMLSDVGLNQVVISDPRGDDDDFLSTCWSIQIVRGFTLTAVLLLLTYPVALWFNEPRMLWITPIASIATLIHGFSSSRVFWCRRHVRVLTLSQLEIGTQLIVVSVSILGASLGFGVLALLLGQVASMIVFTIWSHFLPGTSHRDRWHMDPVLRHDILKFGRWIFFSSALTVTATRGDQGLLGRLMGAGNLGLYNVALGLAEMPETLGTRLTSAIAYPTLSRTFQQQPGLFVQAYYRMRLYFDALVHTALGGLSAMAAWLIALMYDDRYAEAGAMLQILAVRTVLSMVAAPCEMALLARGKSEFGFRRNLVMSIAVMIAMPVGYRYLGTQGLLWGTVAARATSLLVLWPAARAEGFLRLHRELLPLPFFLIGLALGELMVWLLPAL
jgi:O-antigen/teichoic acid export membrane protein